MLEAPTGGQDPPRFTPRERELLEMLVEGVGISAATENLGISLHTTRTHVKHLHAKTGTHRLDELVAWAHRYPQCWQTA